MMTTLRSPHFLAMFACLSLVFAPLGCATDDPETTETETSGDGDGDGDSAGDGDGDTAGDGDGDGDGDPTDSAGDGDGDPTGDGDGDPVPGEGMDGDDCTADTDCASLNCYLVPFLGGFCGECNSDDDCEAGGCTAPNPFASGGSTCNMGELGAGCESTEVCEADLTCGTVLDLLGLIQINTCGECDTDAECDGDLICAPVVVVQDFSGVASCIEAGTLPQDSFCNLEGNGNEACENLCVPIDIMNLAEIGGCGECTSDADCNGGTCTNGSFYLDTGEIIGSTCG